MEKVWRWGGRTKVRIEYRDAITQMPADGGNLFGHRVVHVCRHSASGTICAASRHVGDDQYRNADEAETPSSIAKAQTSPQACKHCKARKGRARNNSPITTYKKRGFQSSLPTAFANAPAIIRTSLAGRTGKSFRLYPIHLVSTSDNRCPRTCGCACRSTPPPHRLS